MKLDYTDQFMECNKKAYIISFTVSKQAVQMRSAVTILDCTKKKRKSVNFLWTHLNSL